MILINHANAPIRKERLSPMSKAKRERMELDDKKKSRRDSMMRLKSFETQEVSEIGRKEVEESRGFPILWMRIMEDVFQMKERNAKIRKD